MNTLAWPVLLNTSANVVHEETKGHKPFYIGSQTLEHAPCRSAMSLILVLASIIFVLPGLQLLVRFNLEHV